MKVIYKSVVPMLLVAFSFSSCAAQSRLVVDVRPPVPIVMMPPPPPFYGAVWITGGHVWQGGRYVYVSPRYVHPREARKWKKAMRHSRYDAYARGKNVHHKKGRRH